MPQPSDGPDSLNGRVALVTGAGRRVGRAIAVALGARGMRVAVHYNGSRQGADETVATIRDAGGDATAIQADLGDPAAPDALIDRVIADHGSLGALVNSAAMMLRTPVGEVTVAE